MIQGASHLIHEDNAHAFNPDYSVDRQATGFVIVPDKTSIFHKKRLQAFYIQRRGAYSPISRRRYR